MDTPPKSAKGVCDNKSIISGKKCQLSNKPKTIDIFISEEGGFESHLLRHFECQ